MKKAFTLAEIMIVLSVIAVLTAILLPAARNAMPNEDVLKFKKTHNALMSAIREVINSDKYYLDGDLGVKPDGRCADGYYLFVSLADVLNHKQTKLLTSSVPSELTTTCTPDSTFSLVDEEQFEKFKTGLDNLDDSDYGGSRIPARAAAGQGGIINIDDDTWIVVVQDNISEFKLVSIFMGYDFGADVAGGIHITRINRRFAGALEGEPILTFSYAIRNDGKVITSNVVDEWLSKSIQDKD